MKFTIGSLVIVLVVLVAAAIAYDDLGHAWLVLAGIESPYDADATASVLGTGLSVMGYVALPLLVGLGVSIGLDTWARDRRVPADELVRLLNERLQDEGASRRSDAATENPL